MGLRSRDRSTLHLRADKIRERFLVAILETCGIEGADLRVDDVFGQLEHFAFNLDIGDFIWLDSCYFLLPNDPVGEEAYAVIREAMAATDTVGISRVVLGRRERAVMLEPRGKGIIAWTLRFGDEVRRPSIYFGDLGKVKPDQQLLELADQLVVKKTEHWSEDFMKDPIQEHLLKLIATKQKRSVRKGAPQEAKVINIFEALKASLNGGETPPRAKRH